MALLSLNEPVVAAVAARLVNDLPGAVAELNASVTDGHTIKPPKKVLDHIPTLSQLTAFPTVGIQDISTVFEDDIGSSATGRHRLGVVSFLAQPDPGTLASQLRRYARVVATVVMRDRSIPPVVWGTLLDRVDWGPTLSDEEDPRTYMSWVSCIFDLRDDEG